MTTFAAFPDAEALAAQVLRTALADAGVFSSIPRDAVYPLVTVQRDGGEPAIRRRLDAADLTIAVYGTRKSEARDLADQARRALMGMEGESYSTSSGHVVTAVVTAVDDLVGLTWSPDPTTKRDRYVFSVTVYLHP